MNRAHRDCLGEITRHKNTGGPLRQIDRIGKRLSSSRFYFSATQIKTYNDKYRHETTGRTIEQKDSDVPKPVEHIQQNTYDRRNKKNIKRKH